MALSAKDLISTALAGGVGWMIFVQSKGLDTPLLSSPRLAGLLLLVAGLGMCIAGNDPALAQSSVWYKAMAALGGISAIFALIALFTGQKTFVLISAWMILILWGLTTGRHASVK